jgi:addiction module HigA family antidote
MANPAKKPVSSVPVHPGEVLLTRFLHPRGMSVYELAKRINVTRSRVNDIVRKKRAITAETALRLSAVLGTSAEFWMRLQASYELHEARRVLRQRVSA